MIKQNFQKLLKFLDLKWSYFDIFLKWSLASLVAFQFLVLSGVLWSYSTPRPILMAYDEDSSYGVETAQKTFLINHNGSTTYGPLYYRAIWPLKYFFSHSHSTPEISSTAENHERIIFFALLCLNLFSLFLSCFLLMKFFTADKAWQWLGTSLLVTSFLFNEYRSLLLFMAKPDYFLCLWISLGALSVIHFLKQPFDKKVKYKMSFFWAAAASTKLITILFLPSFLILFLSRNLNVSLKKFFHFMKYFVVFYLVIGFPQNLDVLGYLSYLLQQNGHTRFVSFDFLTKTWFPLFWQDLYRPAFVLLLLFPFLPWKRSELSKKQLLIFLAFSVLPILALFSKQYPSLYQWYSFPFVHLMLFTWLAVLLFAREKFFRFLSAINPNIKTNRLFLILFFFSIPLFSFPVPNQFFATHQSRLSCRSEILKVKSLLDERMSMGQRVLSDPGLPYDLKYHNVLISPEWEMKTDFLKETSYKVLAFKKSYYSMYLPTEEGGSGAYVGHLKDKNVSTEFYRIFNNQTEVADPAGNRWRKFYSDSCSFELWEKIN